MRRSLWLPLGVAALFSLLVIFGYDFAGEASSPTVVKVMFYGSIVGTYAVFGGLAWVQWRNAPRDRPGIGLTISNETISVDFGWGKRVVPLADVAKVIAIKSREDQTPDALFLASSAVLTLGKRDCNRVLHKIGDRRAKLHRFRKSWVLPIDLFGADQADAITAAIETRLSQH